MSGKCLRRHSRAIARVDGSGRRWATLSLVALVASLAGGCGRTLQPRTSTQIDTANWKSGAVVDASQAYPVAFWADACASPKEVELAGDNVRLDQWLPHLARTMNESVVSTGLYDTRFAAIGAAVQKPTLDAGRITYACVEGAAQKFAREAVRVVRIEYVTGRAERIVSDLGVSLRIAVVFGASRLEYEARAVGRNWPDTVFGELGRQVLSDPTFWAAAKTAP